MEQHQITVKEVEGEQGYSNLPNISRYVVEERGKPAFEIYAQKALDRRGQIAVGIFCKSLSDLSKEDKPEFHNWLIGDVNPVELECVVKEAVFEQAMDTAARRGYLCRKDGFEVKFVPLIKNKNPE